MNPAVVVVGSYVQDLAWRCARFPSAGETVVGKFALGPGGKGSNQAVAAARAGAATCFVGAIGRDAFGEEAQRFYRTEGIRACFAIKADHATGTAAILVDAAGQNEIVVALGANATLARRDIPLALVQRAAVVVVQLESNLATTAHVLRLARRAGVTTVLNPAPMRADFDPALLREVDVLIPNEPEFVALLKARSIVSLSEAGLHRLGNAPLHALCRALRVETVIITLGSRGCFVSEADKYASIAGHAVQAVDTSGAGDAFVGSFAAGLVKFSGDRIAAARFANTVAALSVTKPGTAPSMPYAIDVARFIKKRPAIITRRSGAKSS
jgi:ribokinase